MVKDKKNTLSAIDSTILIGNIVDHFDTSLYAFLAPCFSDVFFNTNDPLIGLILTYSVYATSNITRPIGSYIFGVIAKICGPLIALAYSLIGVGIGSILLGLIPSYNSIGPLSVCLLILARMFIGVCGAGENAIARIYVTNNKTTKEGIKSSYLYETSTMLGIGMASLASSLIYYIGWTHAWRICFIIGGFAAIIGFYIRLKVNQNSVFDKLKIINIDVLLDVKEVYKYRWDILRTAFVNGFSYLTYIFPFVLMNSFIPMITKISISQMMALNNIMIVFDIFAIPIIGKFTSNFSPKYVMSIASIIITITLIPMWYFVYDAGILYITFLRIWIVFWGIVFLCPLNYWLGLNIDGEKKYLLTGIGTNLGAIFMGTLTPSIALLLYYYTNSYMSVGLYVTFLCCSAVIAILTKK